MGNDKLALARLFLKYFNNKGWDVAQYASHLRAFRAKKSFLLQKHRFSKNVQVYISICVINIYVNHLIYGNIMLFYTEWELVIAVMMLCDENYKLMTSFCNIGSLLLCFLSQKVP